MAKTQVKTKSVAPLAHGVGRRKSSVARAWLRRGKGSILVNNRDYKEYFETDTARIAAETPFKVIPQAELYDVHINVQGGGTHSQAGASSLAISRAFLKQNEELRAVLRSNGLLTVDSRVKERKKAGQKGARAKFQFVKR
jgi:small subunit ribosomal protein S9